MGPITLFDKSFLQSLSQDESVWFDRFFYTVICPIFYIETLADLAKAPKENRTAEADVRIISSKFPDMAGNPCLSHLKLCVADLLGSPIPMDGRIPRPGARRVRGGNRTGIIYDSVPEEAAFRRWQQEQFLEVEREFASAWRSELSALDLNAVTQSAKSFGIDSSQCKSLEDAARLARTLVEGTDKGASRLAVAVNLFRVPQRHHSSIMERWIAQGQPSLTHFAPYAAFVLSVEVFFQLALAADLISADRPSNRTDIAYLFYLPFCMIFVSSDKLHQRCALFFLRSDQKFVWGPNLKADLKQLNEYYLTLPDEVREQGVITFAHHPPTEGNYLTSSLWREFLRPTAMEDKDPADQIDAEQSKKLVEELNAFHDGENLHALESWKDDNDAVSVKRRVRRKKGSWYQVPKDLPDD